MRNTPRTFLIASGLSAVLVLAACTGQAQGDDCSAVADADALAVQPFADGLVQFVQAAPEAGSQVREISMTWARESAGCALQDVDRYREEGGAPTLEATFVHPVQGTPNLFAIVSWPMWHAGLETQGTLYSVYAYRQLDDTLVLNDVVVKHPQLYGGFEGTLEGEPSSFEGSTEQGVVAMLARLGLE